MRWGLTQQVVVAWGVRSCAGFGFKKLWWLGVLEIVLLWAGVEKLWLLVFEAQTWHAPNTHAFPCRFDGPIPTAPPPAPPTHTYTQRLLGWAISWG